MPEGFLFINENLNCMHKSVINRQCKKHPYILREQKLRVQFYLKKYLLLFIALSVFDYSSDYKIADENESKNNSSDNKLSDDRSVPW